MKNSMGFLFVLAIVFLFAVNSLAQPAPQQLQKMDALNRQIQQERQQIQQETAKLDQMKGQLRALQDRLRQAMAGVMGAQALEPGEQLMGSSTPAVVGPDGKSVSLAGNQ